MKAIALALGAVVLLAGLFLWRERPSKTVTDGAEATATPTSEAVAAPTPVDLEQLQAAPSALPEAPPEDPNWQPPSSAAADDGVNHETVLRMEAQAAASSGAIAPGQIEDYIAKRRADDAREREALAREAAELKEDFGNDASEEP